MIGLHPEPWVFVSRVPSDLPFPEGLPDRVGNFSRKAEAEKEVAREQERIKRIAAASA